MLALPAHAMSNAVECSYRIEPAELRFPVGPDKAPAQVIVVHNSSSHSGLVYKIKTTNPRRYSVRPNSGYVPIDSKSHVSVQIPANKVAASDAGKCKDKFQVLILGITPDEAATLDSAAGDELRAALAFIWSERGSAAHAEKVRCSFVAETLRSQSIPEELPFPATDEPVKRTAPPTPPSCPPADATDADGRRRKCEVDDGMDAPGSTAPPSAAEVGDTAVRAAPPSDRVDAAQARHAEDLLQLNRALRRELEASDRERRAAQKELEIAASANAAEVATAVRQRDEIARELAAAKAELAALRKKRAADDAPAPIASTAPAGRVSWGMPAVLALVVAMLAIAVCFLMPREYPISPDSPSELRQSYREPTDSDTAPTSDHV